MTKQVLVHVRCSNTGKVRREKRNGRDVMIVPSATMPDNVVMNDILYPAETIKNSFETLNRTPAPLGHPEINGEFISARDPEGINLGWIGAWNENVRQEGGRVKLDKVIDIERAGQSEEGKRVLNAIEEGKPIHTSTGLLADLESVSGDFDHKYVANEMVFDHDAILLDEEGAATPSQGVGMMVNSKGEREKVEVVNSAMDMADREMDWAAESALRAIEQVAKVPMLERIKSAIMEAAGLSEREATTNEVTKMNDKQHEELSAKVEAVAESQDKLGETVANAMAEALKPVVENIEAMQKQAKAKEDEELDGLREKIVKANLMDEEAAKELTLNSARALAKNAEPGTADVISPAFQRPDTKPAFKLPKAEES